MLNTKLVLHRLSLVASGCILAASSWLAQAAVELALPPPGEDVVGRLRYVKTHSGETLIDVASQNSIGQDEIVQANPTVSRWLPGEGTKVLLPDKFVLPDAPRTGIVVNIPEMRMYYFPPGAANTPSSTVITYPISVGRMDWKSPMGVTKVVEKIKNPTWTPPESIKREHAAEGDILPDVVPAGPDNPLGQFAMRLGVKGSYLIHGTGQDKAEGIGMMVTHGCMRMYPQDVAELFPKVGVGTQVNLINQSVKVGWQGNGLYIEVSQPLDEDHLGYEKLRALAIPLIQKRTAGKTDFVLNEDALRKALEKPTGVPTLISGGATVANSQEKIPVIDRPAPPPEVQPMTPPPVAQPVAQQNPVPTRPLAPPVQQPVAPVTQPAQRPGRVDDKLLPPIY